MTNAINDEIVEVFLTDNTNRYKSNQLKEKLPDYFFSDNKLFIRSGERDYTLIPNTVEEIDPGEGFHLIESVDNTGQSASTVKAKFICQLKELDERISVTEIVLYPVSDGSTENLSFWEATPSGIIQLWITNQQAIDQFELGRSYYVDFTPAS